MSIIFMRFGISLLLTLVLELPIILLFKARKKDLLLFLLVNILTNPAVVLLSMLTGDNRIIQLLLEIVVIYVEGWYYKKYAENMRHCFGCSFCANGFSYGMGVLLNFLL